MLRLQHWHSECRKAIWIKTRPIQGKKSANATLNVAISPQSPLYAPILQMNWRSDKLVRNKILEEEHSGNRSQAKQCHRSRNEQHDIDSGPLDGLRRDNARSLLECFLAHMTSVSSGSFKMQAK